MPLVRAGLLDGWAGAVSPTLLVTVLPSVAALLLQDRDDTFGRHWVAPMLVGALDGDGVGLARLP